MRAFKYIVIAGVRVYLNGEYKQNARRDEGMFMIIYKRKTYTIKAVKEGWSLKLIKSI